MKVSLNCHLLAVALLSICLAECKKDATTPITQITSPLTAGKSYFISDGTGADANSGNSATSAFKTFAAALNAAVAGDTIFVMNGVYTTPVNITKSGSPNAYITIKAYSGNSPKIYISGNLWNALIINASYIVVDGIEVQGDNANITYADAFAAYTAAVAGGTPNGKYNTNGISIGGSGSTSKFPHHVIIRNCKIHDLPGGGLGAIQADYITFEGNTVYNNAWYMMYGGSGIGILTPFNSDASDITKYKNIIRNNISYGNKTTIPWINIKNLSDGNGIIIDVNQTGYDGTGAAYGGRTLVENNVSFNNGGSGIHSYRGDHVYIINNTAYGNGTVVGYADIYASSATDVKIANNIMYARTGGKCNSAPAAGTFVTYDYNIYFNGTVAIQGAHDKVINPQFANASTDGSMANFALTNGSPAVDAGTSIIFSAKDIMGIARPQRSGIDCGAYELK